MINNNLFSYVAASIDDFTGNWASSGNTFGPALISCSKISDVKLNCTRTPENKDKVADVLLVTWNGDSTFTVDDAEAKINGTYNNDNTIVWTDHDGKRTKWTKDGKNPILFFIEMII